MKKLSVGRVVLILAGVMFATLTIWEVLARLVFDVHPTPRLSAFFLVRAASTAAIMCGLTVWLMLVYRRRYEDRLRDQSDEARRMRVFFENIVQDAGEAIISLDNDNVIRSWNRSAEEIYGYRADEVLGRTFHFLVPPDLGATGEAESLLRTVKEKGFIRNYETRRVRKDGTIITVRITRSVLKDAEGRVIGSSAIVSDITAEKELESRLIQAEKLAAIGQTAASIAHEVRNALAGIAGTVEVLKRSSAWQELPEGVGQEVEIQVNRIAHIVNDLLSYARPGRLLPRPTDIHRILDRVLASSTNHPESSGKKIVRDFEAGNMLTDADPARLEQAFSNVVTNAFQAMAQGGELKVSTRRENGSVTVRFSDSGPGMPSEVLSHAFEPFFTTKVRGTGLGLPIVRTIVEAHHGMVDIQSSPGTGTTVLLRLPAAAGDQKQQEVAACR